MAKKPTVGTITSENDDAALNANFVALRDAFDNTLSLDGSTPNAMNADLDMNTYNLLNVGSGQFTSVTVGGVNLTTQIVAAETAATNAASSASAASSSASAAASSASAASSSADDAAASAASISAITGLTVDELTQLQNIDSTTISTTQWGYLGATDQALATTDTVEFAGLTVDTNTLYVDSTENRVGIGTLTPEVALEIENVDPQIRLVSTTAPGSTHSIRGDSFGTLSIRADIDADASFGDISFEIQGNRVGWWQETGLRLGAGNSNVPVALDISEYTDAIRIPSGTTAQRPGSPAVGDIRWNTTETYYEGYDGSTWNELGGGEVTLAGAETLTNKTLTAPVIQDGLTVDTETANWTGTESLDPANGLVQEVTLTGDVSALTDNLVDGESVLLHVDDGSAYSITWPTITWVSDAGTAPTLQTSGDTVISIWKVGSVLYGYASNGA